MLEFGSGASFVVKQLPSGRRCCLWENTHPTDVSLNFCAQRTEKNSYGNLVTFVAGVVVVAGDDQRHDLDGPRIELSVANFFGNVDALLYWDKFRNEHRNISAVLFRQQCALFERNRRSCLLCNCKFLKCIYCVGCGTAKWWVVNDYLKTYRVTLGNCYKADSILSFSIGHSVMTLSEVL